MSGTRKPVNWRVWIQKTAKPCHDRSGRDNLRLRVPNHAATVSLTFRAAASTFLATVAND
jgi:hypothetical protein